MKRVTRSQISAAWLGLQTVRLYTTSRHKGRINRAMDVLNRLGSEMRRAAIFTAGVKARKPEPRFEGDELGSAEAITFYDGYASVNPEFRNPYR